MVRLLIFPIKRLTNHCVVCAACKYFYNLILKKFSVVLAIWLFLICCGVVHAIIFHRCTLTVNDISIIHKEKGDDDSFSHQLSRNRSFMKCDHKEFLIDDNGQSYDIFRVLN